MKMMVAALIVVGLTRVVAESAAAQTNQGPGAPRELWSSGSHSIWFTNCANVGPSCLEVRGTKTVKLADGYWSARVLWKQVKPGVGPDVLLVGETGGSAGIYDLYALTFGRSISVAKLEGDHSTVINIGTDNGLPTLEFGYSLGNFNNASNGATTVVRIPIRWVQSKFEVDRKLLLSRVPSASDLARWHPLAANELAASLDGRFGGTPTLGEALLRLTLSGHATEAKNYLLEIWPHSIDRITAANALWGEFCFAVAYNLNWKQLGLDQIPEAHLIRVSADSYFHDVERKAKILRKT